MFSIVFLLAEILVTKQLALLEFFPDLTMLNLVYFLASFLKKYFLLYLSFLCPRIHHMLKDDSSTEAVNIASDFVVLL